MFLTPWLALINHESSSITFELMLCGLLWITAFIYIAVQEGGNSENALNGCPAEESSGAGHNLFLTTQFKVVLQSLLSLSVDCRKMKTVATQATWYEPQGCCFQTKGRKNKKCWLLCVTVQNVSLLCKTHKKYKLELAPCDASSLQPRFKERVS